MSLYALWKQLLGVQGRGWVPDSEFSREFVDLLAIPLLVVALSVVLAFEQSPTHQLPWLTPVLEREQQLRDSDHDSKP